MCLESCDLSEFKSLRSLQANGSHAHFVERQFYGGFAMLLRLYGDLYEDGSWTERLVATFEGV